MSYVTEFTPSQLTTLERIIPKLNNLTEGQTLILTYRDVTALQKERLLLYAWLSPLHSGLKTDFRIKILDREHLAIIRTGSTHTDAQVFDAPQERIDSAAQFVQDHLIDVVDEGVALDLIMSKVSDPKKQELIHKEWKDKCSM